MNLLTCRTRRLEITPHECFAPLLILYERLQGHLNGHLRNFKDLNLFSLEIPHSEGPVDLIILKAACAL
jgi:hypothetical protein